MGDSAASHLRSPRIHRVCGGSFGAKRRDPEQAVAYAREALELARSSRSGYVARRLRALWDEFGPLSRDHRVAELGAEIAMLGTP